MNNSAASPATLCYYEIPAPDLDAAASFYRTALGWTIERSGSYMTCCTPDGAIQCGLDPTRHPASSQSGVLIYLKVSDIAGALDAIRTAGGAVVQDKSPVGPDAKWGYSAIFRDASGNQIGLWCQA